MANRFRWASLVFGGLIATGAQAHDVHHHHSDPHEHHHNHIGEAHVHGAVLLQFALQGQNLLMALQSPAINLLGFEQRAHTPEQIQQLRKVEAQLHNLATWLTLDGGKCTPTSVTVDFSGLQPQTESTASHRGHGDIETHADIELEAQWTCAQPDKLRGLHVMLFSRFPGVEKVTVQWALDSGAGERVLTGDRAGLRFGD